jgi:hypothetical protein
VLDEPHTLYVKNIRKGVIFVLEKGSNVPIFVIDPATSGSSTLKGSFNGITATEDYDIVPSFVGAEGYPTRFKLGPLEYIELTDAIKVRWVFKKSNISFVVNKVTFTSKIEGALIEFIKEGALVKGFDVEGIR